MSLTGNSQASFECRFRAENAPEIAPEKRSAAGNTKMCPRVLPSGNDGRNWYC